MTKTLIITDNAYLRLKALKKARANNDLMLRISVSGGGCSGFMYNYEFTTLREEDDIVFSNGEEIVLIDPSSLELIAGSTFDFVEELGNSYFSVTNPKATAKCGCGNSFAV